MDIKPITREEMYLAAAAGYDVAPPEPITRKEVFLAKLAGKELETPVPFTRRERFMAAAAVAANKAVIESFTITENGTYEAPDGVAGYNPVTVDVEPVLQDKTITENGTYTADSGFTGLGKVIVDIASSGGSDGVQIFEKYQQITGKYKTRVAVDFGFKPDFLLIYAATSVSTASTGTVRFGVTTEFAEKYGTGNINVGIATSNKNGYTYDNRSRSIDCDVTSYVASTYICGCDETGFTLGLGNFYSGGVNIIAMKLT